MHRSRSTLHERERWRIPSLKRPCACTFEIPLHYTYTQSHMQSLPKLERERWRIPSFKLRPCLHASFGNLLRYSIFFLVCLHVEGDFVFSFLLLFGKNQHTHDCRRVRSPLIVTMAKSTSFSDNGVLKSLLNLFWWPFLLLFLIVRKSALYLV